MRLHRFSVTTVMMMMMNAVTAMSHSMVTGPLCSPLLALREREVILLVELPLERWDHRLLPKTLLLLWTLLGATG